MFVVLRQPLYFHTHTHCCLIFDWHVIFVVQKVADVHVTIILELSLMIFDDKET